MRLSSWVPDKCAIVVPRDREFVGVLGHLDPKSMVVCVHNPSRGMAVARVELVPQTKKDSKSKKTKKERL